MDFGVCDLKDSLLIIAKSLMKALC